jgi:hypothetical protein
VAFTSEKRWITIEKSLFRNWPLIPNFHLSIFVRCKTKDTFGAVCALGRIWP